jgi:hypothetical protein
MAEICASNVVRVLRGQRPISAVNAEVLGLSGSVTP